MTGTCDRARIYFRRGALRRKACGGIVVDVGRKKDQCMRCYKIRSRDKVK